MEGIASAEEMGSGGGAADGARASSSSSTGAINKNNIEVTGEAFKGAEFINEFKASVASFVEKSVDIEYAKVRYDKVRTNR